MPKQQFLDLADLLEDQGQALLDLVADLRAAAHTDFPENGVMYRQNEPREEVKSA